MFPESFIETAQAVHEILWWHDLFRWTKKQMDRQTWQMDSPKT